jgi:outer membrane lipoprotein
MKRSILFPLTTVLGLLLLGGCANVLSKEALRSVTPGVTFMQVKANPEAFKGETIELGGQIVNAQLSQGGSTLEILSYNLDSYGQPQFPNENEGRFLAKTDRFLDPALYKSGRMVTLTGTVVGKETKPIEKVEYTFQVFRIGEIYLWPQYPQYPYPYTYPYYPGPYYYYPWGSPYYWGGPYPYWYNPWYGPYPY